MERERVVEKKIINNIMLEELREKIRRVKQDSDIGKDTKGTQPAKYYAKDAEGDEMSDKTKSARAKHFKNKTKMDDDNPKAYTPAPGDKDAETKPSQHTKKFKKMYGEDTLPEVEDLEIWKELEEGKYVAGVSEILSTLTSKFKKEAGERYQKNSERGLAFINQLAKMVGASVTDKKQQKGKLFMKNEYEINEDATATAELKAKHTDEIESLKQKHMDELETLKDRHQREVERQNNLNDKEKQDDQIQKQRDADRKSSERERRNQREDRNYKKEYENYHSDPEQIKRRAQRNKARRLLKAVKNEKELRGKDVHHKDGNPNNNDKKNLSVVTQNYNRKEPRLR